MPSSNPAGMLRAKKLADEAKSFSTIKKKAEANVVRWEWATSHRTEPEPGYFETRRQARGKPLETEPTDWKEDRAHEGFDAQNRIVALHVQRNTPNWQYETFYRYEPGGIARFSYDYGDNAWLDCVYLTVENDRVVQADHIYPRGHRTEVYRFDTNGHYAGYDTEGVSAGDKKPFKGGYDFDTAPDGTILRVWWLWPDKPREVFWEHASVKAAKKAAKAAAATKPAAKKPAAKKPAATKTPAKKTPAKKTPAKKPTKR